MTCPKWMKNQAVHHSLHFCVGELFPVQYTYRRALKSSSSNYDNIVISLVLCPMSESLSGKREGLQDNATRKKGSLLLTRVRAPAASNAVVRGQIALRLSCYTNL